jgi:hypothetical protein
MESSISISSHITSSIVGCQATSQYVEWIKLVSYKSTFKFSSCHSLQRKCRALETADCAFFLAKCQRICFLGESSLDSCSESTRCQRCVDLLSQHCTFACLFGEILFDFLHIARRQWSSECGRSPDTCHIFINPKQTF